MRTMPNRSFAGFVINRNALLKLVDFPRYPILLLVTFTAVYAPSIYSE
jgi:hypothetical protein